MARLSNVFCDSRAAGDLVERDRIIVEINMLNREKRFLKAMTKHRPFRARTA